jgi:hypothetical protein
MHSAAHCSQPTATQYRIRAYRSSPSGGPSSSEIRISPVTGEVRLWARHIRCPLNTAVHGDGIYVHYKDLEDVRAEVSVLEITKLRNYMRSTIPVPMKEES